jgi:signal transduction histidine kinase
MQTAAEQKQLIVRSRPGNGQPSAVELAVPLILRGQVIGVLGVKRDRTEIWDEDELTAVEAVAGQISLALENARLTAEQGKTIVQLKDVDRLKSEFLTSMSHELRTPLNSIIGFADVLLQGIDGELNPVALNDIQLIYNSGQHLLALINDILDLSKIEAGKMELVREPLSVADAVNEVLAASSSLLQKKSLALTANVSRELPHILADRLRFNQIVLNLVSNAVKFTEQGGVIISAQIDPADPGKMRVEVADTGIGIPQNKINAIFDRFSQADSSTTRKYGGSGLGLTICKQLVEMHGGRIGICNQPQGGSMFYFTIPLAVEGDEDDLSDFLIN